ncbi:hypothetical protein BDZ89DRAFT_1049953 [Hymenopellis radicata]|nr:hypothetical protein BDZ89DRAFT_1049953 [Hymenopellis radicata]
MAKSHDTSAVLIMCRLALYASVKSQQQAAFVEHIVSMFHDHQLAIAAAIRTLQVDSCLGDIQTESTSGLTQQDYVYFLHKNICRPVASELVIGGNSTAGEDLETSGQSIIHRQANHHHEWALAEQLNNNFLDIKNRLQAAQDELSKYAREKRHRSSETQLLRLIKDSRGDHATEIQALESENELLKKHNLKLTKDIDTISVLLTQVNAENKMIPELESMLAGKEQEIEEIRRELAEASSAVEVLQANALRDQEALNQAEHRLQEEFTLTSIGVAGHNDHKGSLQKEISISLASLSSQGDVADCPYSPVCPSGNRTANRSWAWIKFLNETNFAAILLPYEDKPLFFEGCL